MVVPQPSLINFWFCWSNQIDYNKLKKSSEHNLVNQIKPVKQSWQNKVKQIKSNQADWNWDDQINLIIASWTNKVDPIKSITSRTEQGHTRVLSISFHFELIKISRWYLQEFNLDCIPTLSRKLPITFQTPSRLIPDNFQTPYRHYPDLPNTF